jgi:hypothetical protein
MPVSQCDAFEPVVGSGVALRRGDVNTDEFQVTLVRERSCPLDRARGGIRAIVADQDKLHG